MRVACFLVILLAACGDESVPAPQGGESAPSGGGNPTTIGSGTRAVGGEASGGSEGTGGVGGQPGATTGCTNDEDISALNDSEGAREIARRCLSMDLNCVALTGQAYEDCIARCLLIGIPELSRSCAQCFGEATRCELENACTASCRFNECGETCQACSSTAGCLEALEECTGLNDDSCPAEPPSAN